MNTNIADEERIGLQGVAVAGRRSSRGDERIGWSLALPSVALPTRLGWSLALPGLALPRVALPNEGLDADGWALIAPFGEWPKTRIYRENGQVKEQRYVQVLDEAAADRLVSQEDSLFGRLKRAWVGIPVFKGHGDLQEADPEAVGGGGEKVKLGVVDRVRKSARGIEGHFALDRDGAEAVKAGYKFPSSFWWVRAGAARGPARLAHPFKLISVALTQFPNISGVESLANGREAGKTTEDLPQETGAQAPVSRGEEHGKNQEPKDPASCRRPPPGCGPGGGGAGGGPGQRKDRMKELLTGWLAANGIALANDASEAQVLEAIQRRAGELASSLAALGDERTALSGQVAALENELAPLRRQMGEVASALGCEQAARQAERRGRAAAVVDLAIARGKIAVAEREAQAAALGNTRDEGEFAAAAGRLLEGATRFKTTRTEAESGKVLANAQEEAQAQYQREFGKALIETGQDPIQAHAKVMKLPGLAEKLAVKR